MRVRTEKMGIGFVSGMDFFCNAQASPRLTDDAVQPPFCDHGLLSSAAMAVVWISWLS